MSTKPVGFRCLMQFSTTGEFGTLRKYSIKNNPDVVWSPEYAEEALNNFNRAYRRHIAAAKKKIAESEQGK